MPAQKFKTVGLKKPSDSYNFGTRLDVLFNDLK